MSIETNKEIVRRYIAGYSDLTGLTSEPLINDTARVELMFCSEGLPLTRHYTKAEYLALFPAMALALPAGIRHELRSMVAEDECVMAETECFADLPGGGQYNNKFVFRFDFRDGLIENVREYTDYLHTKQALFEGSTPAQGVSSIESVASDRVPQ